MRGNLARSRRVGKGRLLVRKTVVAQAGFKRGPCGWGVLRRLHGLPVVTNHGRAPARPCIRSLSLPTRLTRNTQTRLLDREVC